MCRNGEAIEQDPIIAYMWFTIALFGANANQRSTWVYSRYRLGRSLTADQLANAARRVRDWRLARGSRIEPRASSPIAPSNAADSGALGKSHRAVLASESAVTPNASGASRSPNSAASSVSLLDHLRVVRSV